MKGGGERERSRGAYRVGVVRMLTSVWLYLSDLVGKGGSGGRKEAAVDGVRHCKA